MLSPLDRQPVAEDSLGCTTKGTEGEGDRGRAEVSSDLGERKSSTPDGASGEISEGVDEDVVRGTGKGMKEKEDVSSNKGPGEDEARKSETKEGAIPILVRSSLEVEDEPETVQKDEEVASDSDSGEEESEFESEDAETEGDSESENADIAVKGDDPNPTLQVFGESPEEKITEDGGITEVYVSDLNPKPAKKGNDDFSKIDPNGGKEEKVEVEATKEASYSGEVSKIKIDESGDKVQFSSNDVNNFKSLFVDVFSTENGCGRVEQRGGKGFISTEAHKGLGETPKRSTTTPRPRTWVQVTASNRPIAGSVKLNQRSIS
ncbi:hypothetical protein U1Q18_014636, partial [Sarracenia purpurea var. burkii]